MQKGKDEKKELVRRILRDGGENGFHRAVESLGDYMREKDSPMPQTWCTRFVCNVVTKMDNQESNDEADNESE